MIEFFGSFNLLTLVLISAFSQLELSDIRTDYKRFLKK